MARFTRFAPLFAIVAVYAIPVLAAGDAAKIPANYKGKPAKAIVELPGTIKVTEFDSADGPNITYGSAAASRGSPSSTSPTKPSRVNLKTSAVLPRLDAKRRMGQNHGPRQGGRRLRHRRAFRGCRQERKALLFLQRHYHRPCGHPHHRRLPARRRGLSRLGAARQPRRGQTQRRYLRLLCKIEADGGFNLESVTVKKKSDSGTAAKPPSAAVKVELKQTDGGWQLLRDGKPYVIKGAGLQGSAASLAKYGGNSFRTWGIENLNTASTKPKLSG